LSSEFRKKNIKKAIKPQQAENIGCRIRQVRAREALTQKEMAIRLGVSQVTMSAIERGQTEPRTTVLARMYKEFHVPPLWLIEGKGPAQRDQERGVTVNQGALTQALANALKIADTRSLYHKAQLPPMLPVFDIGEGAQPLTYKGDAPTRQSTDYAPGPPNLRDPDAFACRLHGNAMAPDFRNADLLVFSPKAETCSGDYACVRIAEQESIFRQVFFDDDNVRLVALDRTQPELRMSRDQVMGMFRLVARITEF